MKIFDCTLFYDEDMILEIRLNMLNKYVDKFVISESKYTHSGEKKKLNFDIKKFSDFKKKIIYIPIDDEQDGLIYKKKNNDFFEEPINRRANSVKRIAYQRNKLIEGLSEANDDDFIFYNDNDEIPNFANFDFEANKNKIVMFKQKLFYYKFNLLSISEPDWYGSRICVKKHLISPQWMRNKKIKRSFLKKFFGINKIQIIENGGWHFSYVKEPKGIVKKIESFAHTEFNKQEFKNLSEIKEKIEKGKDLFNRNLKYEKVELDDSFPEYLLNNKSKFINWIA